MRNRANALAVIAAYAVLWATPAAAQTRPAAPAQTRASTPWEIEAYGGLSLGRVSSGGRTVLPDPGPPITTSSPVYPSWRVASWFVGDGAAFLNNVAAEFGLANRITPLDAVLGSLGLNDTGSALFGVRVRRPVSSRYSAEFGVDVMAKSVGLAGRLLDGVEASRTTFESTFAEVLSTGPFTNPVVTAAASTADGSGREIAITGALVAEYAPIGRFVPFAVAGAGVLTQAGDAPSVGLEGDYRFAIAGSAPVHETDRTTLRYSQRAAFVIVLGGGVRRDVSDRWGVRIDARVLLGPNTARLAIDADPVVATGTPADYIESFTYPNLQFSNNPSTGRQSTLSGRLDGFETFEGGWVTRARATVGVYFRF